MAKAEIRKLKMARFWRWFSLNSCKDHAAAVAYWRAHPIRRCRKGDAKAVRKMNRAWHKRGGVERSLAAVLKMIEEAKTRAM